MTRRLADLVLLFLLAEAGMLAFRQARLGDGPPPRALAGSLGAGMFLVLALRAEAARRSSGVIATLLALAGIAHLFDLRQRFPADRSLF